MIEYGLSKRQLKELTYFSNIFNRTRDRFVLDCILLTLCEEKDLNRDLNPDISEMDLTIELPKDVKENLYRLSDHHDLTIHDTINGVVELVLEYLDLNWSGEYGLESDDMTDQEKLEELKKENNDGDNHCWVKYFG
jgi:hypothetical protein